MPWLMQMGGCAITLIGLLLVLWLGFWLFALMAAFGAAMWLWRYLVAKGVVNAMPGVPPQGADSESNSTPATIIDGEFERVNENEKLP